MSSSTVTLIGMSNYLNYFDRDLFENLIFPEGIDKQTAIDNILLTAGDNELLYPNAEFMVENIGLWSTKWYRTFEKWVAVLNQEYNPLENTDRHEDWSDSHSQSESSSTSTSESSSESSSTSNSESNSASSSDSTSNSNSNENEVSAFNTSGFSDESASKLNGNASSHSVTGGTHTFKENSNNFGTHDFKERTDAGEISMNHHLGYIHGNIGTMTTQYLLREELETQKFNLYDEIAIIFVREYTLAL